jgi:hypothetical protein
LTKHDYLLKDPIDENLEIPKINLHPQLTDKTLNIHNPLYTHLETNEIIPQPKNCKTKPNLTTTSTTTKSLLEKATSKLCNIENCTPPEKTLNIDLNLYQMEEY